MLACQLYARKSDDAPTIALSLSTEPTAQLWNHSCPATASDSKNQFVDLLAQYNSTLGFLVLSKNNPESAKRSQQSRVEFVMQGRWDTIQYSHAIPSFLLLVMLLSLLLRETAETACCHRAAVSNGVWTLPGRTGRPTTSNRQEHSEPSCQTLVQCPASPRHLLVPKRRLAMAWSRHRLAKETPKKWERMGNENAR